jgi:DNA polymerase (family 10)
VEVKRFIERRPDRGRLRNAEVADLLERIALMLEASGEEERFKVVAYRRAANSVRNLERDIEEVWKKGELTELQYVGEGIAKKIDEYMKTGKLRYLEELERKVPKGAPELMKVQGIGPKTAFKLASRFGIRSVSELSVALKEGRLDDVFGESVRASLLKAIERLESYEKRMLLPEAEAHFEAVSRYFESRGVSVGMAGSLRRGKSTVGDLDILCTDGRATALLASFDRVGQVLESGPKRTSVRLRDGVQVDVRVFDAEEYGAAMMYFTGSKDHNIALRNMAIEKGWKLNEYGLFDVKTGERVAGRSEEEVYAKLGLQYIPPELRENRGEIEAARAGKLPRLVRFDEIRGDLQVHSTWSDGSSGLEEMAREAKDMGYEYVAFTDHSVSARIANGLTEERFRRQWKEIERLNDMLAPFRIIRAVELEIGPDGSLDYDRRFLNEFELVGVSLHQGFRQQPEKLTARVVKAISNPCVDFLCHPTNRLIGKREAYPIDMERVIKAARDGGKMLEIDGQPNRLDMDEYWAKRAMEEGVQIVVDSDAHSAGELDNMAYGVLVARRAWLQKGNVANTGSARSILNRTG